MDVDIELTDQPAVVAAAAEDEIIDISDPRTDRYNTFDFISWWKQETVRDATIMVIGAGALGNEVLKNLALMGVGRLFIVDFDSIEDSNLSRSVLYRATDNGRSKAEVAAEAVRELNPDVAAQWLHCDINHDLGLGVYRRMDVVIGCLDNREARLSINKACYHLDKPWVDAAIQALFGLARVFVPGQGACYECTLTPEDYRIINVRMSCNLLAHASIVQGKVPTTPTISAIMAGIQTQEALKLLHGMEVQAGRAFVIDGLKNDFFTMDYPVREECQSHWSYDAISELPTATAEGTTAAELLTEAEARLGQGARLEIPTYALSGRCHACDLTPPIQRPLHCLTFQDSACPSCGQPMTLTTVEDVGAGEPIAERTLAELGVPPLHVLRAHTADWNYVFLELTGDAAGFFDFRRADAATIDTFYERRKQW
jgi:molybdopterin/thiamine biosynthesis adenylyltransferase